MFRTKKEMETKQEEELLSPVAMVTVGQTEDEEGGE